MTDILARLTRSLADRYVIERELGAGGMATVYLAHDVRHDRKVALKVLKPELSAILGGERFLAEIKTTANLQHPHILQLFDSGEANGTVFYVMPFVAGESLRDRLNREKQLPVDEAIRIAREVADALHYAHGHGIVHRDIKPENILLHGGHAMVADFGIALAASRSDGGTRMTETGMSLGTPHYMAPEQAMGEREITAKADVYALGCVLYEMLTGEPPFTGPTAQAIIARVMTESPRSVTLQRHTVPVHFEAVILKALEKLPADRFDSAREFGEALAHPESAAIPATRAMAAHPAARAGRRALLIGVAAGALGVTAAAASLWRASAVARARGSAPLMRFMVQLPPEAIGAGGLGSTIAVSPDGLRTVYVGGAPDSPSRLFQRLLDQLVPVALPGTEDAQLPFFSPDGRWVGFVTGNRIAKVALAGGPPQSVTTVPGAVFGATWTPGDTIIFAAAPPGQPVGLMSVPATGGVPAMLSRPDSGAAYMWPRAMPDGRAVLFTRIRADSARLMVLRRATGAVTALPVMGAYPRYAEAGFITLNDSFGNISALPFDARRLEVTGAAIPIVEGIGLSAIGDYNFDVSASGTIVHQALELVGSEILLVGRDGTVRTVLDTSFVGYPRISPDGRRIALVTAPGANRRARDVWLFDIARRSASRLTYDTTSDLEMAWTPDGRRIAYTHASLGADSLTRPIYWTNADGSGAPEPLVTMPGRWLAYTFEPGGRGLVFHGRRTPQDSSRTWRVDIVNGRPGRPRPVIADSTSNNRQPTLSPDGRWMAYQSEFSGRSELYVRSYPAGADRWQVSLEGGTEPRWSPRGNEIFFRNGQRLMAAQVRTAPAFEVLGRSELFRGQFDGGVGITHYDVLPDGETFVMLRQVIGAFNSLYVTINWFEQHRGGR